jgi:2-polyprenyl-3-methyl-5-hydroxy-6-metoxy-1,4-benzoquinol methylase
MELTSPCPVCGAVEVELLPPPHPFRSVTSGGTIIKAPLKKTQCLSCGLGRQGSRSVGNKTEFYRNQYGLYHKRAGTRETELARYDSVANWILAELGEFAPTSVLDVGCGAGFLLEALRKARPGLLCAGIEPSSENSESARRKGLTVVTGSVPGDESLFTTAADMVLASNVISHVVDPIAFLAALSDTIVTAGRVVIYGHNGDTAGADLLFADIDFSFCRENLVSIAAKVGLEHVNLDMKAPPHGQEDKYVLVFKNADAPSASSLSAAERDRLLEDRRRYFDAWRQLARRLSSIDAGSRPVFNFGASFWSMLLAAYCPEYWGRVNACVVDDGSGEFLLKPIIGTDTLDGSAGRPIIVLGTNPATQPQLGERLSNFGEVIAWNDLIKR